LDPGGVLVGTGDQNAIEVHIGLGTAREPDRVAELHAGSEADLTLDPDVSPYRDITANPAGHRQNRHGISGNQRHRRNSAPRELIGAHIYHHSSPGTAPPRIGWEDPVNPHSGLIGRRSESSGELDQVTQRLLCLQLIHRGTGHLSGYFDEAAVNRHEDHVPVLEPDVAGVDTVQQVVVDVERIHQLITPADLYAPEAPIGTRAPRCVERVEYRAGAGHLIGSGAHHISHDEDLNISEPREGDLELGASIGRTPDSGIHSPQPAVELILELCQGEIGHVDLADLRNDDEAFPVDRESVRLFDVAGENQDQHVSRSEPIVLVNRSGLYRLKSSGGSAESL
jgi:hypothetical protein